MIENTLENTLLLVDMSSLVHPLFHVSSKEPDRDWTSITAIGRVRALASRYAHTAICCDRGRSFRKDISADYKANRPERDGALIHQLGLTEDGLRRDGFAIWGESGYEADDIIATAAGMAVAEGLRVVIASSDKDLMQLVDDNAGITQLSLITQKEYDEAAVLEKFGIKPMDMLSYLALVGDSSDNIKGVKGIGPKNAVKLIDAARDSQELALTDEQRAQFDAAAALVMLKPDAPIDFGQALKDRTPEPLPEDTMSEPMTVEPVQETVAEVLQAIPQSQPALGAGAQPQALQAYAPAAPTYAATFTQQLEPRNPDDLRTMAKFIHESKLFSAYGTPQAVFAVVMAGRELGLGAMASLRAFHVVEGRPTLAADLIRSLVLTSNKAEYFRCTERTATSATFVTKRVGAPMEQSLTFTMEDAKTAQLVKPNSGWTKHPADMLAKTASTKLARLEYPDVTFGLYAPEELGSHE